MIVVSRPGLGLALHSNDRVVLQRGLQECGPYGLTTTKLVVDVHSPPDNGKVTMEAGERCQPPMNASSGSD